MKKNAKSTNSKIGFILSMISLISFIILYSFPGIIFLDPEYKTLQTLIRYSALASIFLLPIASITYNIIGIREKNSNNGLAIAGLTIQIIVCFAFIQLAGVALFIF